MRSCPKNLRSWLGAMLVLVVCLTSGWIGYARAQSSIQDVLERDRSSEDFGAVFVKAIIVSLLIEHGVLDLIPWLGATTGAAISAATMGVLIGSVTFVARVRRLRATLREIREVHVS